MNNEQIVDVLEGTYPAFVAFLGWFVICVGCRAESGRIRYQESPKGDDSLAIHEGIICTSAMHIDYISRNGTTAAIELTEPVMVAMAEQKEEWGYFQFPGIGRADDGTLIVTWQMNADSHKAYATKSGREMKPMMSKDGGLTWTPQDKSYTVYREGYNVRLNNGDLLQVVTPKSKDIREYTRFPKPVGTLGKRTFYAMDSLPEDLQGVFFNYKRTGQKAERIHATLHDPGYLRYEADSMMPVVWWGNIRELADHSLLAGVYPAYHQNSTGEVLPSGISFYRSEDTGRTWDVVGRIPYPSDSIVLKRKGKDFSEPTYVILDDSTLLCVIRTGNTSPMYQTFSHDRGATWSRPRPFTPNGVKPKLMKLKNGVLALVSGRPGVQVRFSLDGTGRRWTDPIDMIPFMKGNGKYETYVSCGYASILETGDDSFLLVYSNFVTKNSDGERRKSIWCRKITVSRN